MHGLVPLPRTPLSLYIILYSSFPAWSRIKKIKGKGASLFFCCLTRHVCPSFLTEDSADLDSIEAVANEVLNMEMPSTPEQLQTLTDSIRERVESLSDVESVLLQSAGDITRATKLLGEAKKARYQILFSPAEPFLHRLNPKRGCFSEGPGRQIGLQGQLVACPPALVFHSKKRPCSL